MAWRYFLIHILLPVDSAFVLLDHFRMLLVGLDFRCSYFLYESPEVLSLDHYTVKRNRLVVDLGSWSWRRNRMNMTFVKAGMSE
jgi:hypothetical protein